MLAALPLILYFDVVWAVAEARGHLECSRGVTDAALSVVIASVNGLPYLGACLDALAITRQRPR